MPATSPAAIAPATSTAPIETHQRIAALPSFHGDGDTQDAPRKAGTCVAVHIRVSRRYRPPALIGCPSWVRIRRTHYEHMFSALPPNSDIARRSRHFAFVPPQADISSLNRSTRLLDRARRAERLDRAPSPS